MNNTDIYNANEITGDHVRKWRKAMGMEQRDLAWKLGISPSTLCRIEKDDRPVVGAVLERFIKLSTSTIPPETPVAKDAAVARGRDKPLPMIQSLAELGRLYQYRDTTVVPSQYYAAWAENTTSAVNQGIDRLQAQSRLEIGTDYFELTHEEAKDFLDITNCDISEKACAQGLTLITRRAVNALSHHFNDPNSVALSNEITTTYTNLMTKPPNVDEILKMKMSEKERFLLLMKLCGHYADLEEHKQAVAENIEKVVKEVSATSAKVDAAKKEFQAHAGASTLTVDQIQEIHSEKVFKAGKYGHKCVHGLIQRDLKIRYVVGRASGNWKEIAQRDFPAALEFAKNWTPSPQDLDSIKRHRIQDGMDPAPTAQVLLFPQHPLTTV